MLIHKSKKVIQAKLAIGQTNDRFEQEADRVADQMVGLSQDHSTVQRKCENCEEEDLQMKPLQGTISSIQRMGEEEEELQMKGNATSESMNPNLERDLAQSKGSGETLSEDTRQKMEQGIGADFSKVKIHKGDQAVQMNRQLNARAFTNGNDVYFNSGEYQPESKKSQHLLAHELTHVVQQGGGSDKVVQRDGIGDIPEATRKKIKIDTDSVTGIGIPPSEMFEFGKTVENWKFTDESKKAAKDNTELGGIPAELHPGMLIAATLLIDTKNPLVNPNYSITLKFDFGTTPAKGLNSYPDAIKKKLSQDTAFRFTVYKSGKVNKLKVEDLGVVKTETFKPEDIAKKKKYFDSFFKVDGYTTADVERLYIAIAKIDKAILTPITGIKFLRAASDPDEPGLSGLYSYPAHTITIYDRAYKDSMNLYGDAGNFRNKLDHTVSHEMGHAFDYADKLKAQRDYKPQETKANKAVDDYNLALKQFKASVEKYYNEERKNYKFKDKAEQEDFESKRANHQIDELKKAMDKETKLQAEKKKTLDGTKMKSGTDAAQTEFTKASLADGSTRITDYAGESWKENFAENFAFFMTDPARMKLLRPKTYKYFADGKYK